MFSDFQKKNRRNSQKAEQFFGMNFAQISFVFSCLFKSFYSIIKLIFKTMSYLKKVLLFLESLKSFYKKGFNVSFAYFKKSKWVLGQRPI